MRRAMAREREEAPATYGPVVAVYEQVLVEAEARAAEARAAGR